MRQTVDVGVKDAAGLLLGMDDIVIIAHINPDGDTLGCGFALWAGLSQLKKKVRMVCADAIPPMYGYLVDVYDEAVGEDGALTGKENIITVDTASPPQMGEYKTLSSDVVLAIDHHGSNKGYARYTLNREDWSSCAEIVYDLLVELGVDIDGYMASAIYTGISTDTGCFRYRNTTVNSHIVTVKLMNLGIDIEFLNRVLFETKSREFLELQKMALESLSFFFEGRVAVITITQEMLKQSGAKEEDVSHISSIPRSVEGVEVGLVFREQPDDRVKCSVRTTSLVDASKICGLFGGGGHHGAAGFKCSGQIEDIRALAVRAAIKELKKA